MTTLTRQHAWRRFLLATALAVLLCAGQQLAFAHADTPAAAVAAHWGPSQHVVVPPGANPTLSNPNALNNQIGATGMPIYVALTSDTPHDLGLAFGQKLGHLFKGVIVTANAQGVHAAAVDTAGGNQAPAIAAAVTAKYGTNLDQALHQYVVDYAQAATTAAQPQGSVGAPAPAPHKTDLTWLWILLLAIVAAVLVGFVVLRGHKRAAAREARRAEQAQQAAGLEKKLIRAASKVNDMSDWMTSAPVDVSTDYNKASVALSDAQAARDKSNLDAAETHLETVDTAYSRANKKVNPPPPHTTSEGARQARAVPHEDRKQATINARTATGQTVVINNNDYRTSQSGGYTNQWPGGMYGGAYWAPGFYPYSFWGGGYSWSLTDMVIADTLLEDRWAGQYDYGYGGANYTDTFDNGGVSTQDTNWQGDTTSQGGWDDSSNDTTQDDSSSQGGWQDDNQSSGLDDSSITTSSDSWQSDPTPSYSQPDDTPSYSAPDDSSSSGGGWADDSSSSSDSGGGSDW